MPHGHPNLRSQLHFSHNQEGDHEVHDGHVVALDLKKKNFIPGFISSEEMLKRRCLDTAYYINV
jgi:hypothetical protein